MQIIVKSSNRWVYPPTGEYVGPPGTTLQFDDLRIQNNFKPYPLRPPGVRQPQSEAPILGRIRAKIEGRGSIEGDILNR